VPKIATFWTGGEAAVCALLQISGVFEALVQLLSCCQLW
jgi:hypothetical protein